MRARRSVPPRHMGKGSDKAAYRRASMGMKDRGASGLKSRASRSGLRVVAFGDSLEERCREIALAGVGQHREDHGSLRCFAGEPDRGSEGCPGGDTTEDAFTA